MQYRPFGTTDMNVSALGFGAMRLPTLPDKTVDLEQGVDLLRRGIDLGINYIDTAYVYINGTSEIAVGKAIKPYPRESLYLATKIPVRSPEDGGDAKSWRAYLETCLQRFDTPYIDNILFHGLSWATFEQIIALPGMALAEARRAQAEGLVRNICFSSHDEPENIIRLIDTGEFAGMLVQYNYLDRHNEEAIAHAARAHMGVAIMGPVAGGRLVTPQGVIVDREGALELKTPELALRYVWQNPHVSTALSGMSTMQMIEENVAAASRLDTLSPADAAAIDTLLQQNQKLADLYCTGCSYCMPCPNDVNIPENFRFMNWFRVWGMEEQAKEAYAKMSLEGFGTAWGDVIGLPASQCVQCGECEPKCPQNIHIIDQLQETADTLGA